MNGIVASVLTDLFEAPVLVARQAAEPAWYVWRSRDAETESRLYLREDPASRGLSDDLLAFYGRFGGGFLIGDSLKMACIDVQRLDGLGRSIDELEAQPELRDVRRARPGLRFFLDASNVWFYGVEKGRLYCYDAELEELDELGDPSSALRDVIADWCDVEMK